MLKKRKGANAATGGKQVPMHPLLALQRAKNAVMAALGSSRRESRASSTSSAHHANVETEGQIVALGSLGRAERRSRQQGENYTCIDWRAHDLTKPTFKASGSPEKGDAEGEPHDGPEEIHEAQASATPDSQATSVWEQPKQKERAQGAFGISNMAGPSCKLQTDVYDMGAVRRRNAAAEAEAVAGTNFQRSTDSDPRFEGTADPNDPQGEVVRYGEFGGAPPSDGSDDDNGDREPTVRFGAIQVHSRKNSSLQVGGGDAEDDNDGGANGETWTDSGSTQQSRGLLSRLTGGMSRLRLSPLKQRSPTVVPGSEPWEAAQPLPGQAHRSTRSWAGDLAARVAHDSTADAEEEETEAGTDASARRGTRGGRQALSLKMRKTAKNAGGTAASQASGSASEKFKKRPSSPFSNGAKGADKAAAALSAFQMGPEHWRDAKGAAVHKEPDGIDTKIFGPFAVANAREARSRGRRKSSLLTLSGFVPHGHNMSDKLDRPPEAAIGVERVEILRWVTAEVRDADPALYPQWYKKWRRLTQDGDLQPERFHRWMHRAYGNAFTLRVAPQMVRLIGSAEVRRRLLFAARAASERSAKTRWRGAIGKVRAYARFLIAGRSDKGRRPMHILPDGTREPLTHRIPTDPAVLTRLIPNVGTIEGKNRDERKNGVLAMDKVYNARETFKLMHKQAVQFRTKSAVHSGAASEVFRDALRGLKTQSPLLRHLNLSWEGLALGQALQLSRGLKGNAYLQEIDLSGNQLGNDGTIAIGEALPSCPALRKARFGFNLIGCAGAAKLFMGTHGGFKCGIEELRLDHNTINEKDISLTSTPWEHDNSNEDGLKQVAYYFATNETLTHINLASNRIGDAGCRILARGLTQESTGKLRVFDLSSNDISDVGVQFLFQAINPPDGSGDHHLDDAESVHSDGLKRGQASYGPNSKRHHSKLEVLSVSGSHRITDEGGKLLMQLAGGVETLTMVDVGKTRVSGRVERMISKQTRFNRHRLMSVKELGADAGPIEPIVPDAFAAVQSKALGTAVRSAYDDLLEEEAQAEERGGRLMPHEMGLADAAQVNAARKRL